MGRWLDYASPCGENVPNATTTSDGFMSAADKIKLDGLGPGGNFMTTDTAQAVTGIKTFAVGADPTFAAGDHTLQIATPVSGGGGTIRLNAGAGGPNGAAGGFFINLGAGAGGASDGSANGGAGSSFYAGGGDGGLGAGGRAGGTGGSATISAGRGGNQNGGTAAGNGGNLRLSSGGAGTGTGGTAGQIELARSGSSGCSGIYIASTRAGGNAGVPIFIGGTGAVVTFDSIVAFNVTAIGFFGTTTVAQQTKSGNTATTVAGSTTNVFINTTFTGGVGTTDYTIGDIVRALKNYNLLVN